MNMRLNQTCIYGIMPLYKGGFMRKPKRDYWTERGFSSREEWTNYRTEQYRLKTSKRCPGCNELCWGNRTFCSNKCNLLGNIEKTEEGCWIWKKCKNTGGYGLTKDYSVRDNKKGSHQKGITAHRLSYITFKGKIPKNKFVCHTCDVPACCNPDHLFLGTSKDNAQDALSKNRLYLKGLTYCFPKGKTPPRSKLKPFVEDIRKRISNNDKIKEIAKFYDVSVQSIYYIKNGQSWKEKNGGI